MLSIITEVSEEMVCVFQPSEPSAAAVFGRQTWQLQEKFSKLLQAWDMAWSLQAP